MKTNNLAPEYVTELKSLYEGGLSDTFLSHITQLRESGWPLSSIASVLDVSKTTVAKWANKEHDTINVETPDYYIPPELTQVEKMILQDLAEKSSRIRRFTAIQSPARQSARELEVMLMSFRDKGVSISDLASACGVSRRAINQRLDKYRED